VAKLYFCNALGQRSYLHHTVSSTNSLNFSNSQHTEGMSFQVLSKLTVDPATWS